MSTPPNTMQGGSVDVAYLMQDGTIVPLGADAQIVWLDSELDAELEFEPTIEEIQHLVDSQNPGVRIAYLSEVLDGDE